jgi:hypothetical protein
VRRDRVTVLADIRSKWGSEVAFDEFVRHKLRRVLLNGKRSFFSRPGQAMSEAVELLF